MTRTITAADSTYALVIPGLYDIPQILQGYMADAAFATAAVNPSEIVLGVDGIMSAGYTPYLTQQTVSIMPDSPSSDIFENWLQAQKAGRFLLFANATIIIPGLQRKYACTRGALTEIQAIPTAGKVMQGRPFGITWQDVTGAPL